MSSEEFRENGYAVVDWIVNYLEEVEKYAVLPSVEPGDIASSMPDRAPQSPEAFAELLADLDRVVMPGIAHWQSPNWFAYFPANTSPPSILAEFVAAGLGAQGMLWESVMFAEVCLPADNNGQNVAKCTRRSNRSLFRTLSEVRQMTEIWMKRYNQERPHNLLNDMMPVKSAGK